MYVISRYADRNGVDIVMLEFFFFFKQKTAYERRISDWSSDVCSSDLFVRSVTSGESAPAKLAVGIDVRNRHNDLSSIPEWLSTVGAMGLDPRLVFFDTDDMVLLRRYADTRRRHPLSHLGLVLADAISLERQVLKPLPQIAANGI